MATESGGARQPAPWVVGLLGLALMIGGWKLSTYVPPPEARGRQEVETDKTLEKVRAAVEKSEREGSDPSRGKLGTAVRDFSRQRQQRAQEPPYQLPGRLAVWGGLALFVLAGFLMYRQQPAAERPPEGEGPESVGPDHSATP